MDLPYSSSAVLARLDFSGNFVNVVSANSTPTIQSIVDVISGQAASQTVVANQPTLSRTVQRPTVGFYDAAVFNKSSQVLAFDTMASVIAALGSFTVFVAFNPTTVTGTQDLFTFGKTSADGYWRLALSGSSVLVENKNDTPTTVAASGGTVVAATNAWVAMSVSGGTMTAYLNGTSVASASVTGTTTVTQCSIGALRNNSTTTNYFGGSIYEVALYKGLADMTAVGSYFSEFYEPYLGINRTV